MTVRIPRPEYHVARTWETNLEPGTWYEITGNKPSQYGGFIGVGFVFDPPERPDRRARELWGTPERDYRDVDGSFLKRYERGFDSIVGGQIADREAKLNGFDRAIARYRATLRSK
jgi:hypothetical protein